MKYNHAYTIGFEVVTNNADSCKVTKEQLFEGILKRLASLQLDPYGNASYEIIEACIPAYDSHEVEDE